MAKRLIWALIGGLVLQVTSFAQITAEDDLAGRDGSRIISTAVPFLTISPDARAAGMADVGVATTPDANATYWNPAKLPFIKEGSGDDYDMGFALSYTPWLRKLINDMSLSYLTGYKRLREEEVISASLLYFNLGSMTFRDNNNVITGEHNPREFAFNVAYSRKLSNNLGLALGLKFIRSNLAGSISIGPGNTQTKPGHTAAADVSVYYNKEKVAVAGRLFDIALGANLSNVGAKISYTNNDQADFIPTNLKLGFAATTEIDAYNKITLAVDANKLLVPTPPTYLADTTDEDGNKIVDQGRDPDETGLIGGMFGSFADAPGGFSEEMKEFMISIGAEYWYDDLLAVRAGYYFESQIKGNRKYFTLGLGVRYNNFGIDFSYLIPVRQNNPLQDTLRLSLIFNIKDKTPNIGGNSIGDDS